MLISSYRISQKTLVFFFFNAAYFYFLFLKKNCVAICGFFAGIGEIATAQNYFYTVAVMFVGKTAVILNILQAHANTAASP